MADLRALDDATAAQALAADRRLPLPPLQKGFGALAGLSPDEIVSRGLTTHALGRPVAVVEHNALDNDIARLAAYCASRGVRLAPHIKTSMSPQIFVRQMRSGAWGATVATIDQVRVALAYGVRRVLLANELGGADQTRELVDVAWAYPEADLLVCADSEESVALLGGVAHSMPPSKPLGVLVEVGALGGRAGARTEAAATAVARAVAARPGLRLRGATAFEGVMGAGRSEAVHERIRDMSRLVVATGALCAQLVAPTAEDPVILSAGGSVYFDVVADVLGDASGPDFPRMVVLRSGAYVVHDRGYLDLLSPLAAEMHSALTVLARVIAVPEPGLAIIGAGKRDIGSDIAAPTITAVVDPAGRSRDVDLRVVSLNDQHAYANFDPDGLAPAVGDEVRMVPAHPCTTFDRWRFLAITDTDGVITDIARTYF